MAEQPTDNTQHQTAVKEEETQSTKMDYVSARENKQAEKQQHPEVSASPASKNSEAKNDSGEDMEQTVVKNSDSTEEKVVPLTEGSCSPDEDKSPPPESDDESRGDRSRDAPRNEQLTVIGEEISGAYHTTKNKEREIATPPTQDNQVDGPKAILEEDEETRGTDDTVTEAGKDDGSGLKKMLEKDTEENAVYTQTPLPKKTSVEDNIDEQRDNVETIGPVTEVTSESTGPVGSGIFGGSKRYLAALGVVVVLAILVQHLLQSESPPQRNETRQIDIFLRQMEKLKTQYPSQRPELWKRSQIHLLRHLQTAQPTEPVSLILTAGLRAEKTLHCLAQGLASAFSSALNASVLHIDGASKASQDSDQVKLDIDSKLQGAFEGDQPVAVIHRFEELPPGSTLIFYRYCDHENAAFKTTCLMFTVLLGEEEEISATSHLSAVEEMVDDHLQKKFLSDVQPVAFDRMDLDKYGGLWSRISHLILPVAAEERIELEGCNGT